MPADTARTVASGRPRRRTSGRGAKSPEKLFAAEINAGTLPSVRQIKARAKVGTPKAQEIRDSLAAILQEAQPEAA